MFDNYDDLRTNEDLVNKGFENALKGTPENPVPPLPEQAHHPGTPGACSRPIPFRIYAPPASAFPKEPNPHRPI